MAHIRSKDTKPEVLVRSFLFAHRFRFRLHRKDLPGKPDIVLPRYKTVIFINGCFWHGHAGCKYSTLPTSNCEFWEAKISGNIQRDKKTNSRLVASGWKVIEIWQCQLKSKTKDRTLQNLITELQDEQR